MRAFLHGRSQQLLGLIAVCNNLLKKYAERDVDLDRALADFLRTAAKTYADFGRQEVEGKILSLSAELNTAHRGINPFTLQAVTGRRRELEATVAFKILQTLSDQIASDFRKDDAELLDGRTLLVPIVLAAFQRGFISDPVDKNIKADVVEALWRKLSADPEIGLAVKRVSLTLSFPDIVLLLEEMIGDLDFVSRASQC
jgi:hypothetical protein